MISTSSKRKRRIIVYGSVTRYGPQYQLINLLRGNNVPRTSRIFCSKIAIFSQFQVYLGITQAKQVIYYIYYFLIISISKRKRRIIVCGLVTRYGPQSVASASGLIVNKICHYFIVTCNFLS